MQTEITISRDKIKDRVLTFSFDEVEIIKHCLDFCANEALSKVNILKGINWRETGKESNPFFKLYMRYSQLSANISEGLNDI